MKFQKSDVLLTLKQLRELNKAVIDSSSIIYMQRAGFLEHVTSLLEIYAPDAVMDETGFTDGGIKVIFGTGNGSVTADSLVVSCAFDMGAAVISDDRGVLKKAEALSLDYFNSLMMLCFLFLKGAIDPEGCTLFYNRLKSFARYSSFVYEYGEAVMMAIVL
jgi:hypothetical protein